ncbi:MAG: DUF2029 domain-containing protein [Deltaproteobacteria bacterium]|nr:MAG: DUF2029 domain-containing protein [Deltaproteobacteria bacterium]
MAESGRLRRLGWWLLGLAWVVHLWGMWSVLPAALESSHGRDLATYYYAAQVSLQGDDPYLRATLDAAAQAEGARTRVYPLLYPPIFLLFTVWMPALDLFGAYLMGLVLNELALIAVMLALWWGWPRRPSVVVIAACVASVASFVPNNALMGQVNLLVLALTLWGVALTVRGRASWGGALLGLAVGVKLVPLLIVGWWLARGRWREARAAGLSLLGLGIGSVLAFGVQPWRSFLGATLPSLRSGAYGGLGLPVHLLGNHSLADWWHRLLPSGGALLSPGAQLLTHGGGVLLLAVLALAWRRARPSGWVDLVHASGWLTAALLLPVFTYEHHLVWALPAMAVTGALGWGQRGLGRVVWLGIWGLCVFGITLDLGLIRESPDVLGPWAAAGLREGKTVGLLGLLVLCGIGGAAAGVSDPAAGSARGEGGGPHRRARAG